MNNKNVIVSISCLAYNHEPYIRQCLDGFVMQKTDFRFEAIVHDDASTDGTASIIKEYANKYPSIIKPIFEKENQYSKQDGSLRRIMQEACTGKYIAMCEGDDYWTDPQKLQKEVDILEADDRLMAVVTNSRVVDKSGSILENKIQNVVPGNHEGRYDLRSFLNNTHAYPTATVCYRNTHSSDISRMQNRLTNPYFTDWPLWVVLHTFGDFYYLDEVTSSYRINPTSVTHTYDRIGRSKVNWEINEALRDVVPKEYEDIHKALDNKTWLWIDLGFAYKHERQFLRMLWCFFVAFLKSPKELFGDFYRRLSNKHKNID